MSTLKIDWISKDGASKLYDQYNQLVELERPQVVIQVQNAAAEGDRSENAEYQYGKLRLRNIDQRIRALKQRIDSIKVKEPSDIDDKISFLSWVEYLDITDGLNVKIMHIVGPDELEHGPHRISYLAPFAKALLGKYVGEIVEIVLPTINRLIEVLTVSNEPLEARTTAEVLAYREADDACQWITYLSTVSLLDQQTQQRYQLQIVSPLEEALMDFKISYQSQLAKAILGKAIGNCVTILAKDWPWAHRELPLNIEVIDII
jgi:transcription elongation factor GreB